jgi:hypothetical protein
VLDAVDVDGVLDSVVLVWHVISHFRVLS